jgi:hypothetical protein
MSKSIPRILPVLMVAITALLCLIQPALAQAPAPPPHELLFTENSSTSLSVTYDGSTTGISVLNVIGDNWTVLVPPILVFSLNPSPAWFEPDSNPLQNFVVFSPAGGVVFSDKGPTFQATPDELRVLVGVDNTDQLPIFATFDDDGDVARVPETGSSFGLLFLSLIALLGANRLRSQKLIA